MNRRHALPLLILGLAMATACSDSSESADDTESPSPTISIGEPTTGPTEPAAPPTPDEEVVTGDVALEFIAHPSVSRLFTVVNSRGDVLVRWIQKRRPSCSPSAVSWIPATSWAGPDFGKVGETWLFDAPVYLGGETQGGFVLNATSCGSRGDPDTSKVWAIDARGQLDPVRLVKAGDPDRDGHSLVSCGQQPGCEFDPDTGTMWPLVSPYPPRRAWSWEGSWDDDTSLLFQPTLGNGYRWSANEGDSWHETGDALDVAVVRYADRIAYVENVRGRSGPIRVTYDAGATWSEVMPTGIPSRGYKSWQLTPDGRLFGSIRGSSTFLVSTDSSWQRFIEQRLPDGFRNAELQGGVVYAVDGQRIAVREGFRGRFTIIHSGYLTKS